MTTHPESDEEFLARMERQSTFRGDPVHLTYDAFCRLLRIAREGRTPTPLTTAEGNTAIGQEAGHCTADDLIRARIPK